MLALSPSQRILLGVQPVDFRKYAPSINMRSFAKLGLPKLKPCFAGDRVPEG